MADAANTLRIEIIDQPGATGVRGAQGTTASTAGGPPPLPNGSRASDPPKGRKAAEADGEEFQFTSGRRSVPFGLDAANKKAARSRAAEFAETANAKLAGGEGGLAGIGQAMAKIAPPLAAVAMVSSQVAANLNFMDRTVKRVAAGLEGLAQNQLPSAGAFGEVMADFQSSIPIVGEMMAAQTRLMTTVVTIPEKLTQAFLQRASALSGYSGAIAGATATADVRSLLADVREAQALGPGLARLVDAESRFQTEIRELLLPIKKFVVEVLADRLELLADGARVIANLPDILKTLQMELASALILASDLEFTKAKEVVDKIPEKLAEKLRRPEDIDLLADFAGNLENARFSKEQFYG